MSDTKQIKSFPFECKIDEDKGIFEGYASVFGNVDAGGDVVEKGAFKKTIKEFFHRIKVLFQHNPMFPIGKPKHLEEDSKGLFTVSKISMTTLGKDVLTLLKDKVITEMSFGYDVIKKTEDEDGTRHLKELKLWEYSPVTWGMNDQTSITSAKAQAEMTSLLYGMNDYLLKEGRVLSEKNMKLVKNAIEVLQALLNASEPDNSTPDDEPLIPKDESVIHSFKDEIVGSLESLTSEIKGEKLLQELKDFGKKLRKGD